MPVTQEQAALLRAIATRVEEHPVTFHMRHLVSGNHAQLSFGMSEECGTTACIAGYALLHEGYRCRDNNSWFDPSGQVVYNDVAVPQAAALLGQASTSLFYADEWPHTYQRMLEKAGIDAGEWNQRNAHGVALTPKQQVKGAAIAASLLRALAAGEEVVFPYERIDGDSDDA